jgi:hypothetical protein
MRLLYNTVIICFNNNNAVINNNGRPQGIILHFKIPMGTRKNFFKICNHSDTPALLQTLRM